MSSLAFIPSILAILTFFAASTMSTRRLDRAMIRVRVGDSAPMGRTRGGDRP